jgi:hypothetical protein
MYTLNAVKRMAMNCFGKYRTDAMLLASLVMLEVKDTYINIKHENTDSKRMMQA